LLFGRCEKGLDGAYQPFREALGQHMLELSNDELRRHRARHLAELARLVPELRDRLADLPATVASETGADRYRLIEALSGLLSEATRPSPILFFIDDLQWADLGTLLALRHLSRQPDPGRLLVLVTERHGELECGVGCTECSPTSTARVMCSTSKA